MVDLKRPADLPNRLLVGFSAGLDSTVLLHALMQASRTDWPDLELCAIHLHHGLQPAADDFAHQAQLSCQQLGVPLQVMSLQISQDAIQSMGLEAAARSERYRAFARAQAAGQALVLAHHLDDQIETTLLQWIRGAGLDGLVSMQAWSPERQIWRPLLGLTKAALQDYARAHALTWVEDPTNLDESLDRNRLRQRVLPELTALRAGALQAMGRSIELLQQDKAVLDELTQQDWQACLAEAGERDRAQHKGLDLSVDLLIRDRLLGLSDARLSRVLRLGLTRVGSPMPPARRLQEFIRQLRSVTHDTRCQLVVSAPGPGEKVSFQVSFRAGFVFFTQ
ncbi:MAG: tRNA lysidine(34) synthetase TilS [Burkholderiaceae bacterium]